MLIMTRDGKTLYNIDTDDVEQICMKKSIPVGYTEIIIHRWRQEDDIIVGHYQSEEIAQKNYDGLVSFFRTMIARRINEESDCFHMSPDD